MLIALLVALALAVLVYYAALVKAAAKARVGPGLEALGLGAVVNFFDTLGIGSFATTTAWLKFRKLVPDRLIPPLPGLGEPKYPPVKAITFHTRSTSKFYGDDYAVEGP